MSIVKCHSFVHAFQRSVFFGIVMVFICHGAPIGNAMLMGILENAEKENVKDDSVEPERRVVLPERAAVLTERAAVLPERAAVLPERGEVEHFSSQTLFCPGCFLFSHSVISDALPHYRRRFFLSDAILSHSQSCGTQS